MKKLTRRFRTAAAFLFIIIFTAAVTANTQDIRLIIRGDDMGMTQGSLIAFEKAFNEGILTCASVQPAAPWFEAAAELCKKNPGWCTGVHLTLVAEWRGYRWRPVLPWDKVSSLVDEDGYFYRCPDELWAHKPKLDEIEAEFRAQVELAKKKGLNVQYVDTHYMSPGDPKLGNIVKNIGRDYNVPVAGLSGENRIVDETMLPRLKKKETIEKVLQEIEPGLWLMVCHPGIDSPEQNALIHTAARDIQVDGGVGLHRAEVLKMLTSIEMKSIILKRDIKLTNYRQLWKEKNKKAAG
ncbi:MAG TPA: ChbG/HpnK family deacetylase [Sedimentisphaerales bacterium]|nr:ChbG/HpnK family deacetylase [Sedimentisphaerales bacterium]